jgi:drug/metabolite transporter (DMT)-like permease
LNFQTFAVILFNAAIYRERARPRVVFGAALAFVGIYLVMAGDDFGVSRATLLGDLLSLTSATVWGVYTAVSKKVLVAEDPLYVTTSVIFVSALVVTPIGLATGAAGQLAQLGGLQWIILLYLGIFCIGTTYILWNLALKDPAVRSEDAAMYTYLLPVVGVVTSILWLGEIFTLRALLGCAIIIAALYLAQHGTFTSKKKVIIP